MAIAPGVFTILILGLVLAIGGILALWIRHNLGIGPRVLWTRSLQVQAQFQVLGTRGGTKRLFTQGVRKPFWRLLESAQSLVIAVPVGIILGGGLPLVIDPFPAAQINQLAILVQAQAAFVSLNFVGVIFVFQYLENRTYDEATTSRFVRQTKLMPILYLAIVATAGVVSWYLLAATAGYDLRTATNGTVFLMTATLVGVTYLYREIPTIAAEDQLDRYLRDAITAEVDEQFRRTHIRTAAESLLNTRHPAILSGETPDSAEPSVTVIAGGAENYVTDIDLHALESAVTAQFGPADSFAGGPSGKDTEDTSTTSPAAARELSASRRDRATDDEGVSGSKPGPSVAEQVVIRLGSEHDTVEVVGTSSLDDQFERDLTQAIHVQSTNRWAPSGSELQDKLQQLSRLTETAVEDRNQVKFDKYLDAYEAVGRRIIAGSERVGGNASEAGVRFARILRRSLVQVFRMTTDVEDRRFAKVVTKTSNRLVNAAKEGAPRFSRNF